MNSYQRWKMMHMEYTSNNNDVNFQIQTSYKEDNEKLSFTGGHLEDRLAQFDVRTEMMEKEWYTKFSEVRRGSFLSKYPKLEDKLWNKARKERLRKRGRRNLDITWESLPASHVQFLHWIGFDYQSALPLPNEETTQALGFLGYDFMGRIVEKAILLKWLDERSNNIETNIRTLKPILQLNSDDQLTKNDIKRALNDSTVSIKPLYNVPKSISDAFKSSQLYFGPGYEERIEMEIEQICMIQKKKTTLSPEDIKFQKNEDKIFEKLKAPPKLLDALLDVLDEECRDNLEVKKMKTNHE